MATLITVEDAVLRDGLVPATGYGEYKMLPTVIIESIQ